MDDDGITDQWDNCSKLDVYLGDPANLSNELNRVRKKTGLGSMKALHFHIDPSRVHTTASMLTFFKRILSLVPQITKIHIGSHEILQIIGRGGSAKIPVSVVIAIIEQLLRRRRYPLGCVRFFNVKLEGSWQDFQNFGSVVRRIDHLERFNLDKVTLLDTVPASQVPPNATPGCWLDPVMQAVATLPRLKHLRVLGSSDFGLMNALTGRLEDMDSVVQSQTLRLICSSNSLVSLCLIHFNISDDNTVAMARALESNRSLRELDIDGTLGSDSARALVSLMEHNNFLEDLNICIRGPGENDDSNATELMKQKDAEIIKAEDEVNLRLAEGVKKSTLVNFALFRGRISVKSQDAFRNMVKEQYCLESLTLYTGDDSLNRKLAKDETIKFHCKLNKMGRRQLLTGKPQTKPWKEEWKAKSEVSRPLEKFSSREHCLVDILARSLDDLSSVFYFLTINPCICDSALQKLVSTEEQEKVKKRMRMKRKSTTATAAPSNKRTRLYRAAKYRGVSYK